MGAWGAGAGGLVVGGLGGFGGGGAGCRTLRIFVVGVGCTLQYYLFSAGVLCPAYPLSCLPVPLSLPLHPCASLACLLHLYKIVGNVQMGSSNKFCTISVQQRWRQDSGERGGEDMPWVVLYWLEN